MKRHTIAIYDADGNIRTVEADQIKMCAPTSKCVKFWVQTIACVITIGIGIFFMIYQGASSIYFNIGEALLAMGIGVLIPSPKYEHVIPKHVLTSRPVTPILEESEREPTRPGEDSLSEGGTTDVILDVHA